MYYFMILTDLKTIFKLSGIRDQSVENDLFIYPGTKGIESLPDYFRSNNINLKYEGFTPSGVKIWKLEKFCLQQNSISSMNNEN